MPLVRLNVRTALIEYFKATFPARSALAASGLAFNARTEIECIAFVPGKRGQ